MPEIREATTEDIPDLMDMFTKFILPSNAATVLQIDFDCFLANLNDWVPNPEVLTIRSDNGFLVAFLQPSFFGWELLASELVWWVDVNHRNTGEGKALKEYFEQWAASYGCTVTTLGIGSAFSSANNTREYLIKDGYTVCETNHMKRI